MSLVSSLNMAKQALAVNQAAISVISNNISNVDNSSYCKLSVNLSDVVNSSDSSSAIMQANALNGVELDSITRYSDDYLQGCYWEENSTYSYYNEYSAVATNIEDILNELQDSGLTDALSSFYSSLTALNNDPTDSSARENVVSAAENVCSVFNNYYNNLNSVETSLVGDYTVVGSAENSEIGTEVDSVNSLLDQLANINKSILKVNASGGSSTSLLDERDALVTKLTEYINVGVTLNENDTATISLGKNNLVSGSKVTGYLDVVTGDESEPVKINIVKDTTKSSTDPDNVVATDVNDDITGGKIGAILDVCGTDSDVLTLSSVIGNLNTLASNFASVLNSIQIGDPNGDGSVALCLDNSTNTLTKSNTLLFVNGDSSNITTTIASTTTGTIGTVITTTSGSGSTKYTNTITTESDGAGGYTVTTVTQVAMTAANISVNSAVVSDSDLIAAARVSRTVYWSGNYTKDTGNNSNSTLMYESQTAKCAGLDNQTFSGYLSTSVSDAGYKISSVNDSLITQKTLLSSTSTQLSSKTGVNLDEELSNMIIYQRAYESAARVFTTCSELLQELINLGR